MSINEPEVVTTSNGNLSKAAQRATLDYSGGPDLSIGRTRGTPEDAIGMPPQLLLNGAWKTLLSNKLRATLSALGVMIGVFSVVTLISLAQMGAGSITNKVSSAGVNLLSVVPHPPRSGGIQHDLTVEDARAIMQHLHSLIEKDSPVVGGGAAIQMGGKANNSSILGVTTSYMAVGSVEMRAGHFITQEDDDGAAQVAVLAPSVVQHLLGNQELNPLGKRIEINGNSYRIVGITKAKGSLVSVDLDDHIFVPLSTAMHRLFNRTNLDGIALEARSPDAMKAAQNSLTTFLRQRHHIVRPYANNDDFTIGNQAQALDVLGKVGGVLVVLVGGIGLISLLVGGIGIMNIMLVSVTERTREIGLRKSVGATQSDILWQFLIEAVFISLIGGAFGILLSVPVIAVAAFLFHLPLIISPGVLGVAFLFSVAVGVIFGSYPAAKAARQNPIDCLRFE